jgi:hypothetical protein
VDEDLGCGQRVLWFFVEVRNVEVRNVKARNVERQNVEFHIEDLIM